jgi:hypothetical protein
MMSKVQTITVRGKARNSLSDLFQFDSLADLRFVVIESCGEENVYFTFQDDAGNWHNGYCKCL